MNVNRHNYEEFFVRYVDKELTAEERCEVEAFVLQNNDLAEEFKQLQQATLQPDYTIHFNHKNLLYKSGKGIDAGNYETYFLLYVDNELVENEREDVERFVLQHPQMQQEFMLLQQTKLVPEEIVFAGKQTLYRQERKPVVLMPWLKMMAAALVTGIAVTLYLTIPSEKPAAIEHTVAIIKPTENKRDSHTPISTGSNANDASLAVAPVVKQDHGAVIKPSNTEHKPQQKDKRSVSKEDSNIQIAVNNKASVDNLSSSGLSADITSVAANKENYNEEVAANIPGRFSSPKNTISKNLLNKEDKKEPLVQQAVYKEIDTDADVRENSILFGNTSINKNKLRGLFKKAGSLFNKKDDKNNNDKTIQIASFEIKG